MIKWIRRSLFIFTVVGLLATNVLTLTNTAALTFASGLVESLASRLGVSKVLDQGAVGVQRKNSKLTRELTTLKSEKALKRRAARRISKRIATRTARNVATGTASALGESIPYYGIALIAAGVALDVYDGCETMKDVGELMSLFEANSEIEAEDDQAVAQQRTKVCGTKVPTSDEVLDTIDGKWDQFYSRASNSLSDSASSAKQSWDHSQAAAGEITYLMVENTLHAAKGISKHLSGTYQQAILNTSENIESATEVIKGTTKQMGVRVLDIHKRMVDHASGLMERSSR